MASHWVPVVSPAEQTLRLFRVMSLVKARLGARGMRAEKLHVVTGHWAVTAAASRLNHGLKHLQNWWKNVKDWYVKLSKRTSGQATKMFDGEGQVGVEEHRFYKREANILEDMEVAAAAEQASTRRKRRLQPLRGKKEEWMWDLDPTWKANQALLERLLEERSQPQSR
ncbi:hypothetical protein GWK47_007991 [Chionoecetes opilio]|uniref:Uncharacterized protein n=1 Tax=Chionoecetes opilio TaxID=41210 RepID=A0A8J5CRX4_CHIOP|nr:hypothetical protein GWK47_007991 [Chionoecetes opilio]